MNNYNENAYQAFSLAVVLRYMGGEPLALSRAELKFGDVKIPSGDTQSTVMIPYLGKKGAIETYSASDILHQRVDLKKLTGKIVLVGSTAVGLGDYHPTPIGYHAPGVEIQASLIEGILQGKVKASSYKPIYEPAILLLIGIVLLALLNRLKLEKFILLLPVALVLIFLASLVAWRNFGVVIPVASFLVLTCALVFAQLMLSRVEWEKYKSAKLLQSV